MFIFVIALTKVKAGGCTEIVFDKVLTLHVYLVQNFMFLKQLQCSLYIFSNGLQAVDECKRIGLNELVSDHKVDNQVYYWVSVK